VLLREGASWTANLNPAPGAVSALSVRERALVDDPRLIDRLLRLREQRLTPRKPPAP
jgi:hypothetical protein